MLLKHRLVNLHTGLSIHFSLNIWQICSTTKHLVTKCSRWCGPHSLPLKPIQLLLSHRAYLHFKCVDVVVSVFSAFSKCLAISYCDISFFLSRCWSIYTHSDILNSSLRAITQENRTQIAFIPLTPSVSAREFGSGSESNI